MSELREPVIMPCGGSYTMSLDEQLEIFDKYVDQAYDMLLDWVYEREVECKAGARARLVKYHKQYKDASFKRTEKENVKGGGEEHEDLLNYIIFALYAREKGR